MGDDETARLLEGLAGLRLPDTGGVAPGWWALLGATLVALGAAFALRRVRARRAPAAALRADARAELDALRTALVRDPGPGPATVREVLRGASVLARRLALAAAPRERVAALQGERWLAELDALCERGRPGGGDERPRRFVDGPGRLLAVGPYEPEPSASRADLDALLDAVDALSGAVADAR